LKEAESGADHFSVGKNSLTFQELRYDVPRKLSLSRQRELEHLERTFIQPCFYETRGDYASGFGIPKTNGQNA
jgi:hypothetical protein